MSRPDQSFGWRKRIGLLSPTVIETAAYDFFKLAPDGVSMCATTSNIEHWSKENFKEHVIDPLVSAGEVSRLAPRRLHHPHRHAGGDDARQGVRGRTRQADHRHHRIAGHHQHPLRDPRAGASRRAQRRRGDALSPRAASVGAHIPEGERLQRRRRAHRGRRVQAIAGRDAGPHRRGHQGAFWQSRRRPTASTSRATSGPVRTPRR